MLKKIVTSLALTVGLAIHPSMASESKTLDLEIICTSLENISQVLSKYQEEPVLTMVSNRDLGRGVISNATVFFMNPTTKSWTLVEQFTKNDYCVIAVGDKVDPYFSNQK